METKAYVLDYDLNENEERNFNDIPDEDLIKIAESDGMVFTLQGFQNALNQNLLSLDNAHFRFIDKL